MGLEVLAEVSALAKDQASITIQEAAEAASAVEA
jgi:hypothetical protein